MKFSRNSTWDGDATWGCFFPWRELLEISWAGRRSASEEGGSTEAPGAESVLFSGWTSFQKISVDGRNPTPWKINMEPTNHPFRKENDLPNLHEDMFHVNLPGCTPPGDSIPDLT